MPSSVWRSKTALRLSMSRTLARVMWRSNLSSSTNLRWRDALIDSWCVIMMDKKNCAWLWFTELYYAWLIFASMGCYFASLHFTSLSWAQPDYNYTLVYFTPHYYAWLSSDITLLCLTPLYSTLLYCASFGYNFASLHCTSHNSTSPYSAYLRFVWM